MKKISFVLIALLVAIACKKNVNFNSDPLAFKDYISGYTSGLISAHSGIKILLNEPLSQDKMDKVSDLNLFEISPKVKGKVVCVNPTLVEFMPEKPLAQNTEYRVSFHVKKLYAVPKKELEIFNFTVKTFQQAFRVRSNELQSYNRDYYFLSAELLANDQIPYETAKEILKATLDGKKVGVKFQSQGTNNKFVIIFDSLPRLNKEQTLQIKWDVKDIPKENLIPFSYTIPQKGVFKALNAKTDGANQAFSVNFSDPLEKEQDFTGLISLSNTNTALKYSVNGNVVKVFREEQKEGDYKVHVSKGIKNIYGDRLEKEATFDIKFLDRKSVV